MDKFVQITLGLTYLKKDDKVERMKGKAKNKRKIGKVILIGIGFFLTIILTFTTTLAWFYDSDWASKSITMAGTVGIRVKDGTTFTSGSGNLHFEITTEKAYPGQAIDVSASCYNDGGKSGLQKGSKCYVRAHFAVYTDIGKLPVPGHYVGGSASQAYITAKAKYDALVALGETPDYAEPKASDYEGGAESKAYKQDLAIAQNEVGLSASELYKFLNQLIELQNDASDAQTDATKKYYWNYYKNDGLVNGVGGGFPLSSSGTLSSDVSYYIDGKEYVHNGSGYTYTTTNTDGQTITDTVSDYTKLKDKGYFYLCLSKGEDAQLKELDKDEAAIFLWNNRFIIPWKLTNASAEKDIFVAVEFQAIQTYIPIINTTGIIDSNPNNQLPDTQCTIKNKSVQTVFNSCYFTPISTVIGDKDYGNSDIYESVTNKADAGL